MTSASPEELLSDLDRLRRQARAALAAEVDALAELVRRHRGPLRSPASS